MNAYRLLILSLLLALIAAVASAATPASSFDSQGRFIVEADLPAGSRYALLEISSDLSPAPWRGMIAGAIDGRAAHVTFRLPAQGSPKLFARVRSGPETTLPAAELTDAALFSVSYPGDGIDEQVKVDFLMAAGAKMREWRTLPLTEYHSRLITWCQGNALVSKAQLSPLAGDISVSFTDGDICVLLNRPRSNDDPVPPVPVDGAAATTLTAEESAPAAPRATLSAPALVSIPGSNRTVTAFSFEAKFANSAPTVGGWLTANGYRNSNFNSTSIPQILAWSSPEDPLGVLFWQAHGCSYLKPDGSEGIGVVTRETWAKGNYDSYRKSHQVLLAKDDADALPVYQITSDFIRANMHFAPHSIVVLDSCFGANAELANAFIAAGAGSYASWDWLSGEDSPASCLKVFDRLLGTNQEPPISTPAERSFSLQTILWWMANMGYDIDPSAKYHDQTRRNAKLTWYHHAQTPGHILKPSVMRVLYEYASDGEQFTKFLIEGDFGTDPGPSQRQVLWGGVPMQVLHWNTYDGIVIKPPATLPTGNVQVILHKSYEISSNQLPITEWRVPFTYEVFGQGSLYLKMVMNVKMRADVHGSRGAPEMPVQYLGVPFSNLADCTGSVDASGSYQPDAATTITWSGGCTLSSVDREAGNSVQTHLIDFLGVANIGLSNINPFNMTATGDYTATEKYVDPQGGVHTTVTNPGFTFAGFVWPVKPLTINFDTAALFTDTRTLNTGDASTKLTWPTVIPLYAPNANTVR